MLKREDIIREAKTWIDVPYKHAGRDRFGIDCIGPIIKVGHALNIFTFDIINYSKRPTSNYLLSLMKQHMDRIKITDAKSGDVLVCREPRHPCHCGFLEITKESQRFFIHAYAPARKVVREALVRERDERVTLAFKYRGIAE